MLDCQLSQKKKIWWYFCRSEFSNSEDLAVISWRVALDSADGYSHQIMIRPPPPPFVGSDIPSSEYFPNQILSTTLQSFVRWQRASADFSTLSKLCPLKALNCVTKLQATCSASQFWRKRKYHGREIRHQKFFAIFFLGILRCMKFSE